MQAENGKPKLLKRSLTAYQIFMAEEREKLKISHSEMKSPQELMGEIGRRWKLLDSKTQYVEKAEKLKQERQAAMDAVSAAPSQPPEVIESADAEEQKKKKKKKKKKKDKQPEA